MRSPPSIGVNQSPQVASSAGFARLVGGTGSSDWTWANRLPPDGSMSDRAATGRLGAGRRNRSVQVAAAFLSGMGGDGVIVRADRERPGHAGEVRAVELGTGEVGADEAAAGQVRAAEIGADQRF